MAKKRKRFIYGKGRPPTGVEPQIRSIIGEHRRGSLQAEYAQFGAALDELVAETVSLKKDDHGRVPLGPTKGGAEFFIGPYDEEFAPRLQMPVPDESFHAEQMSCLAFVFESGVGFSETYTTPVADPSGLIDKKELSWAAVMRAQEVITEKLTVLKES